MPPKHSKILPNRKTTTINCPHQVAGIILITLGILFLFIGCRQLYEWSGQTPEQAQQSTTHDTQAVIQTITEAAPLAWKLAAILATSIGTILTGLLAKWLSTEKKVTKALITGIEKAEDKTVKQTIKAEALAAGVESVLHSRVKQLT